jgi:hypothetical protein
MRMGSTAAKHRRKRPRCASPLGELHGVFGTLRFDDRGPRMSRRRQSRRNDEDGGYERSVAAKNTLGLLATAIQADSKRSNPWTIGTRRDDVFAREMRFSLELTAPELHCSNVVSLERTHFLRGPLKSRPEARSPKGSRVSVSQTSRPRGRSPVAATYVAETWIVACRPSAPTKFVASWLHRHHGLRPRIR